MIFTLEFPERDTLVFQYTGNKSPPGHVTDTMCKPDITAALQPYWKDGVVRWPFVRFAGEVASKGKSSEEQKEQAISCLHYLLLARPDLYVAQGLLSSGKNVIFPFGIGGEGIFGTRCRMEGRRTQQIMLLYVFTYRLYEPGHFADPTYTETEFDEETTARYTIKINHPRGTKNPFATRTHILSNPNFKFEGNDLTILKDRYCRVKRRFEERTILDECVHKSERVPGVVVAAYGERIESPISNERCKLRLGVGESGSPFTSIPTLSKVLETLYDVLEGI